MNKFFTGICISLLGILSMNAQTGLGIQMEHGTWKEAVDKAKSEKKLIFIDFYTQWCGPCLNMAETVFTLPEVGYFYNNHFVNTKIDAENGEGIELAKKYTVKVYPTYLFVDPETETVVHRSSSSQSPEQFIYTGQSALEPEKRSFYLEKEYNDNNRTASLLTDYILYQHSIYQREKVKKAFDELIASGKKLEDKEIWDLFVKTVQGFDNHYIKDISDNYAAFTNRFGKKAVDEKLAKETTYGDLDEIGKLCDFEGKAFNIEWIRINTAIRNKNYEEVTSRIDAMITDSLIDRQKLIDRLKYAARYFGSNDQLPEKYQSRYVEYLRFIAYNDNNRKDGYIHQEYAVALENIIKKSRSKGQLENTIANPPRFGKKDYSMRSPSLKLKPVKK